MYLPADIARMVGCSVTSVRNYTKLHTAHLSDHTRETPRQFTQEDARVIAFVFQLSKQRTPHQEIAQRLDAGELTDFDWQPPTTTQTRPQEATQSVQEPPEQPTALVLVQHLSQRMDALQDAARSREIELQEQINTLQNELGKAQGELKALKRPWWERLFGG